MVKEHHQLVEAVMILLDLGVTALAWLLCYFIRFQTGWIAVKGPTPSLADLSDAILISLLLTGMVFQRMGLYLPRRVQSPYSEALDVLRAVVVVWVIDVVLGHFLHSAPISRRLRGMYLILWPAMLIAYRVSMRMALHALRSRGRNLRSVAIVGAGRSAQKLVHDLRRQRWAGYAIRYLVDDARAGERFLDLEVEGPIDRIEEILALRPVDAVFVALPKHQNDRTEDVLGHLPLTTVDVNVVPDLLSFQFLRHRTVQVGSLPVVNLTHCRQSGLGALGKRVFDVVGAAGLLLLLSPLMAAIALVVKFTSPGGVIYRQKRASIGGHEFWIYKFRSMVPDAEKENGATWGAEKNDPRITGIGRLLRKTSLDELPQLFNVLLGDMSLVGPRPERPEFIERFRKQFPRYMLRHHVKAGMTGWAQVNGYRGRTSLRKRLQYDLDYINRWSLLFDVRILVLTLVRGLFNPNG